MKNCNSIRKEFFIFVIIMIMFILPPIFSNHQFSPSRLPENIFLLIIIVVLSACYEEIIYRLYLPAQFHRFYMHIFGQKSNFSAIIEFIPVLLFGLAHSYLGFVNIFYSMVAGIIFRCIYCKLNKSFVAIFIIIIIHSLHNLIMYAIMFGREMGF